MRISITAGIPENEIRRKHSENTKNPEMTEERWHTDLGVLGLRSDGKTQRRYWGTRVHENWQNLGMDNNETETRQADDEK